jgi:hypothetical protein
VKKGKEKRRKREEQREKRKEQERGHTIMIPIPSHITLIIINEYNKFSNDQDHESYYAGDINEEGNVHEYAGEEPFWGPFVCHCGCGGVWGGGG